MIIFDHVTKTFAVGSPALQDVSFQIEAGEFVFLTGHSGAGKTTIAKLLTKEYHPTEGEIRFGDVILNALPKSQIHHHRRNIGVIYQDYKLLSDLTVGENIALPLHIIGKKNDEIQQRLIDLLELVGLVDKLDVFPSQLSGGESQRISIARALATAPSVLFADEPTGNLDRETSDLIVQILLKVNAVGTTVIMATHDDSFLHQHPQHRVFHLENGSLTIHGEHRPKKQVKKTLDFDLQTVNDDTQADESTDAKGEVSV